MVANHSEFFQAFKSDINTRNPQILPNPVLVRRIHAANNPQLSPEERTQARVDILDSVAKLMTTAIDRFAPNNVPPEELIGEAYETVERCIRNFDTAAPGSFPNYLYTSLRLKLRGPQTVIDLNQPFHIPNDRRQQGYRINKAFSPLAQRLQHEPTRDEWYKATEYDPTLSGFDNREQQEDFEFMHNMVVKKPYVRIGHDIGTGNVDLDSLNVQEGQVEEVLIDETSMFEEKVAFDLDLTADMSQAIANAPLTSQQRLVFELKVAGEGRFKTNDEVAAELGVSASNVSQLWRAALKKLRRPLSQYRWELE
jgi:RNA polymerase sigma factor (sigma-70 family)